MPQLGKKQKLKLVRHVDFGVYLAEDGNADKAGQVLLPAKYVPDGADVGDEIEVFLYLDSEDRPVATTQSAKIHLHEVALLEVREVNARVGAFLDMGLERDLLLPFAEQTTRVSAGETVLVAMYQDRSDRLCATMNVYDYLHKHSPYRVGDTVKGRVYETSENFGIFVAVDDRFSGLIPRQEAQGRFRIGEVRELRVTQVLEDGKLDLSARKKAYQQIDPDTDLIREYLEQNGGVIEFDDSAPPALIAEKFGISKAAFKRALGRMLREKTVVKKDGKILEA